MSVSRIYGRDGFEIPQHELSTSSTSKIQNTSIVDIPVSNIVKKAREIAYIANIVSIANYDLAIIMATKLRIVRVHLNIVKNEWNNISTGRVIYINDYDDAWIRVVIATRELHVAREQVLYAVSNAKYAENRSNEAINALKLVENKIE